jgi:hypothetical protein
MLILMDKENVTHLFDELVEHIRSAPWFSEEWDIYRDGDYIHIFKNNWLEDNHNGVHFETYVGDDDSFPIVLHAEKDVPDRDAFVQRVVMGISALGSFEGLSVDQFDIGVNDYTILKKDCTFDAETFISDVLTTLEDMQFVVPLVDENLL